MRSDRNDDRDGSARARRASSHLGGERTRRAAIGDWGPSPDAGGFRALRDVALCGFLVAALGACRSVAVVPDDESWTVTGADKDAEATWATGTVQVKVPLALRGDATMLTGSIRNAGAAAFVTFAPSLAVDRRGLSGALSGERAKVGGRWTATLVPWRTIEVPAGTPESPGTVDFALSPDRPWTAKEVPEVGATITWVVDVADESGEASCPVFFHVGAASPGWVDDPRTQAAVTLVGLAELIV
jgi:hypothetical protein